MFEKPSPLLVLSDTSETASALAYVKGYIFDDAKIQRLLNIADDDREKIGKIDDCISKVLKFIDRDTNPICLGRPIGTDHREVVITIAEGDNPVALKEREGTVPAYLKKVAKHLFSGPHVLEITG